MLEKFFARKKIRIQKINEAREAFVSWREIANSPGWKIYEQTIDKKIENIKNRMQNDAELTGEDLKRLQLALKVWDEVKRVPKELEEKARGTIK